MMRGTVKVSVSRLCILAAAAFLPGMAQAKVGAVIVQSGETHVEPGGVADSTNQPHLLGPETPFLSMRFVNHDDHIPAQLCRSFGVDVWLTRGPGEDLPDHVFLRLRHPQLTRPDGVSASEQSVLARVLNGEVKDSYSLDEPWEVQPGEWSFDFIIDGDVIASKTFTITPRPPGSPASICEGKPVS